jgi:hypothetical protein
MTNDEAVVELAAVAAETVALHEAADRNGGGCWWCCGGGDRWRDDFLERQAAVYAAHPDLDPAHVAERVA